MNVDGFDERGHVLVEQARDDRGVVDLTVLVHDAHSGSLAIETTVVLTEEEAEALAEALYASVNR